MITIGFNIANITSDEFALSLYSGNVFISFGSTFSKLANLCCMVGSMWVIIHSWLLFKVTNRFDLAQKLTAAITDQSTNGIKWSERFEILALLGTVIFYVICCSVSYGLSIELVITMIMSFYLSGLTFLVLSNLIYDSLLLIKTCGQMMVTLDKVLGDLQELIEYNGKKPMVILKLKLTRCLKNISCLIVNHTELNQFWKLVISTTIGSFIIAIAVATSTWVIDINIWIKLSMNLLALIAFVCFSIMLLVAARVNLKYRAIYHLLARMCVLNKIGHSLKIKLSYSCTRFRRPIGFTQADGTAIDYMSYHEVSSHNGQIF